MLAFQALETEDHTAPSTKRDLVYSYDSIGETVAFCELNIYSILETVLFGGRKFAVYSFFFPEKNDLSNLQTTLRIFGWTAWMVPTVDKSGNLLIPMQFC